MRVSGPGVTPFGPANQQRLINVFSDVARNLTQQQFRVVLVSDAYTFRRRSLQVLPPFPLYEKVDGPQNKMPSEQP